MRFVWVIKEIVKGLRGIVGYLESEKRTTSEELIATGGGELLAVGRPGKAPDLAGGKVGQLFRRSRKEGGLSADVEDADSETPTTLGFIYIEKGDLDRAITEFHEAIRLNPGDAKAHWTLAVALQTKGNSEEAAREFAAAQCLDPSLKPPVSK